MLGNGGGITGFIGTGAGICALPSNGKTIRINNGNSMSLISGMTMHEKREDIRTLQMI